MNKISPAKESQIKALLAAGMSVRRIMQIVGVSNVTICARKERAIEPLPRVRSGDDRCDFCGNKISKREFHRRTRRVSHKFCNNDCYQKFYLAIRAQDKCKRCGVYRYERGTAKVFPLGYCQACYGLLRRFGFNEEAVQLNGLIKSLKKEIDNGGKRTNQEHGGPAVDAHRNY